MSNYNLLRRRNRFLLAAATTLTSFFSYSQTLIDPATDGGFESGATFAANGWTTANGTPLNRVWYCGTGQTGFTGARAAFIGNNTTTVGTNNATRLVHLYKTVTIPTGATNIQLSFKYKQAVSDNTYDYTTVSFTPLTPTVNNEAPGLVATIDPIDDTEYATFTTVNVPLPGSYAGMTVNLVFSFHSDNVTPRGYGAVDDVSLTYTPGPSCSGTPSIGNIGGNGPTCASQPLSLLLNGVPAQAGINFQWQSSPDGVSFTDISGATAANYTTLQAAATYYRIVATCSVSALTDTSNTLLIQQAASCYCAAGAIDVDPSLEKISNVQVGTLNNSSTSPGGYEDFTYVTTDLQKGVLQNMTVTASNPYEFDEVIVFIDYNHDGDFNDPGETVMTSAIGYGPYTGSFTIPTGTATGLARMRIRLHDTSDFDDNATPCNDAGYGQVEDYTINITCPSIAAPTGADATVCANNSASLSASSATGGVDYTWFDQASGGTQVGTGTPFVTPALTATTTYYVEATMPGCPAATRTAITANVNTPNPIVTANGPLTFCPGGSVELTTSAATGNVWSTSEATQSIIVTTSGTYTVTETVGSCSATSAPVTVTVNAAPTVDAGADVEICEGESVALTATGTGTFSWDNGVQQATPFEPTVTMTYTVTVDNGECTATDDVTVTVNPAATVDAGNAQTVCEGENVTLSATGTGPFTWDNGAQQDVAFAATTTTTYTVTAGSGACEVTDQVTITVNPAPNVEAGNSVFTCSGATVTLTATGDGPFTWDNGVQQGVPFTPTATTTYTVTVDNGQCTASDNLTVTVNPLPSVNGGSNLTVCAGETVTLTATGDGPFTWDNGIQQGVPFTATATTMYTVTVDNGTCSNGDIVTVTVNPTPVASAALSGGVNLTASPAGQSYQWINCATSAPIAGATSATFTATANGNYAVIVTNGSDCSDTSGCVAVASVGIDEYLLEGISFFPNPTVGEVQVVMPETLTGTAHVYDAAGRLIVETAVHNGSLIDLSALQTGMYTIRVSTPEGMTMERIVKE